MVEKSLRMRNSFRSETSFERDSAALTLQGGRAGGRAGGREGIGEGGGGRAKKGGEMDGEGGISAPHYVCSSNSDLILHVSTL